MKLTIAFYCLFSTAAIADDEAPETFTNKELPGLEVARGTSPVGSAEDAKRGAAALDLPVEYIEGMQQGLHLLYSRDYKGTRKHFEALDEAFPGTAISPVGDVLVWQARMLENYDFRYDNQYQSASRLARKELELAIETPGHDGWDHFLMGAIIGLEAIHLLRHEQYVASIQRAYTAMDHLQRSEELAPDFVDVAFAEGLYKYWRTVITLQSKMLPNYGDHRAEGIELMQSVQGSGLLLAKPSTFAMVYTWLEERDHDRALAGCLANREHYPNSVINNMLTGQTYLWKKEYANALAMFDEVLRVAPKNNRVHYYRGLAQMRQKDYGTARASFDRYLASDHIEDYQRAAAYYRIGQIEYRQKRYPAALEQYQKAVRESGYKPAKNAIERMKKLRREGKIDY